MKLQQLSVFLENKPGQLKTACDLLAKEQINIQTLSLADSKQFGILRLIVPDWQRAQGVLEQNGFVVKPTEVVAVEVANRPGGLADILGPIETAGLNVEYMYAFAFGCSPARGDQAILVFRFSDADAAIQKLQAAGINPIQAVDLFTP
jgi:hypothetical protein